MAIRTTDLLVQGILEVDPNISLEPFIAVANALVDQISLESSSPSEARLTLIETWLAAHFYCMRDPRATEEHAGPVGATYQSKIDLYLNLSHYGQMAQTLDTSGLLRSLSKGGKHKVAVFWGGTDLCDPPYGGRRI